mmetsp:Transcript_47733/g.111748  ORF Transcript_47733/g.111748 Transcript_47733/m.111748 type:complete len:238 (+) Transcript_47733:6709-7422(+)
MDECRVILHHAGHVHGGSAGVGGVLRRDNGAAHSRHVLQCCVLLPMVTVGDLHQVLQEDEALEREGLLHHEVERVQDLLILQNLRVSQAIRLHELQEVLVIDDVDLGPVHVVKQVRALQQRLEDHQDIDDDVCSVLRFSFNGAAAVDQDLREPHGQRNEEGHIDALLEDLEEARRRVLLLFRSILLLLADIHLCSAAAAGPVPQEQDKALERLKEQLVIFNLVLVLEPMVEELAHLF